MVSVSCTAVCGSAECPISDDYDCVSSWAYARKLQNTAQLAECLHHRPGTLLQTVAMLLLMTAAGAGGIWSRAYLGVSNCKMGLSHLKAIALRRAGMTVCSQGLC